VALSFLNYPALGAIPHPSIEITGSLITHMAPSVAVLALLRKTIKMVLLVISTLTRLLMFGGVRRIELIRSEAEGMSTYLMKSE
jgi:hypothetical protein